MLPSVITKRGLQDIQEAYDYLETKEENLGERLLSQIEEYLNIIELNPYLFKEGYKKVRPAHFK